MVSGVANLTIEELEIETFITEATCSNTMDGEISFEILSSSPDKEIIWTPATLAGYGGTGLLPGDYQLRLTDQRGCVIEEVITLPSKASFKDCENLQIYIPNVFSPNNDGNEDNFMIQLHHDPSIESVASFSIFDRWGNKVFAKENFPTTVNNLDFDAVLDDQQIKPNVLSYVVTFNMVGGNSRSVSGTITILH